MLRSEIVRSPQADSGAGCGRPRVTVHLRRTQNVTERTFISTALQTSDELVSDMFHRIYVKTLPLSVPFVQTSRYLLPVCFSVQVTEEEASVETKFVESSHNILS